MQDVKKHIAEKIKNAITELNFRINEARTVGLMVEVEQTHNSVIAENNQVVNVKVYETINY